MIIILKQKAQPEQVEIIKAQMLEKGFQIQEINGAQTQMIGLIGDTTALSPDMLLRYPFVERVIKISDSYKLAGRRFHPEDSVIESLGQKIGNGHFAVMAGPCSVESKAQILEIAREVKLFGGNFLRGGAFKPRNSPYYFQGLGIEGIELLKIARAETGLPIVSEIMSTDYLDNFQNDVDIIQIGARNMQNTHLLREVGFLGKPVLIKRGPSSSIDELLQAAEYVLAGGKAQVILCERGIRTFETATRNTLDIAAVAVLKEKSHLPVIVDPSHATGNHNLVEAMSLAAVAAGADGLMIEVHNKPQEALCDGKQSITTARFKQLRENINRLRLALAEMK